MIDLDALEALEKAATAGWYPDWCNDNSDESKYWRSEGPLVTSREQAVADARFVVAARGAIPDLIRELRAARQEIAIARERLGPAGWRLLVELKAARDVIKKIYSAPSAHDCPACLAAEAELKVYDAAVGAEK